MLLSIYCPILTSHSSFCLLSFSNFPSHLPSIFILHLLLYLLLTSPPPYSNHPLPLSPSSYSSCFSTHVQLTPPLLPSHLSPSSLPSITFFPPFYHLLPLSYFPSWKKCTTYRNPIYMGCCRCLEKHEKWNLVFACTTPTSLESCLLSIEFYR